MRTEAVPFARSGSGFTRDLEHLFESASRGSLEPAEEPRAPERGAGRELAPVASPRWGRLARLLDRFCSKAQRSGLKPFVTLSEIIRTHRSGILAATGAVALVLLSLGPIEHVLPHTSACPEMIRSSTHVHAGSPGIRGRTDARQG